MSDDNVKLNDLWCLDLDSEKFEECKLAANSY